MNCLNQSLRLLTSYKNSKKQKFKNKNKILLNRYINQNQKKKNKKIRKKTF